MAIKVLSVAVLCVALFGGLFLSRRPSDPPVAEERFTRDVIYSHSHTGPLPAGLSELWKAWKRAGIEFSVLRIPTVQWNEEDPAFAAAVFEAREPLIIRGGPANKWPATDPHSRRRWSAVYLAEHAGALKGVRVLRPQHDGEEFMYYQDELPMIGLDELRRAWLPNFYKLDMASRDFFALAAAANAPERDHGTRAPTQLPLPNGTLVPVSSGLYFSAHVEQLENSTVYSDLDNTPGVPAVLGLYPAYRAHRVKDLGLDDAACKHSKAHANERGSQRVPSAAYRSNMPSAPAPSGGESSDCELRIMRHLWMGASGVAAAPHYDAIHNLYLQVDGRKRFVLLPPIANRALYTFPRLHPSARQTQLDVLKPSARDQYPLLYSNELIHPAAGGFPYPLFSGYDVLLEPGDMLYVPPYWFHYVTAVDTSISLSVWVDAEEIAYLNRAAESPLPIPRDVGAHGRWQFTGHFVMEVLEQVHTAMAAWVDFFRNRHTMSPGAIDSEVLSLADFTPLKPLELLGHMIDTRYTWWANRAEARDLSGLVSTCRVDLHTQSQHAEALKQLRTIAGTVALDLVRVPAPADQPPEPTGPLAAQLERLGSISGLDGSPLVRSNLQRMDDPNVRAVVEIHVMDYIEELVEAAVGVQNVYRFLSGLRDACQREAHGAHEAAAATTLPAASLSASSA